MLRYIVRRLTWLPLLLFVVTFITFALGLYGPGDPVQAMLGQRTNPEAVARVRHELGLDQPLLVQYGKWVWRLLHGDLGESLRFRGQPVLRLMVRALKVSAQINLIALLVGIFAGIPLGLIAAFKQDSWIDRLITAGVVAGISVPTFVIAPILLYFFAVTIKLLPPGGWDGIFSAKAILPVLILSTGPVAILARQTRAAVIDALSADYVRTAKAKGLGDWHWGRQSHREGLKRLLAPYDTLHALKHGVMLRHVLRNALIPIVTIIGLMFGSLLSGSFIVESIFGIPGIGALAMGAMGGHDYPMILAFTSMTAMAYILTNLLVDVLYGLIDPRVRDRR